MDSKFNVVSRNKDSITLEVINYDNTLLRPLMEEVTKDDKVEIAHYYIKHPEIDNPQIYIKVSTGKPQAAIKRTIRKMNKIYESMYNDLLKEKEKLSKKQ
ncbi:MULTISPECIES: DNA-directed RNA polymerase subunit L [Acidiplasma]|jgi:DNA-directed RNA polymerase subunit L|uniref:DNA-directed RNA polymerase subunit Rpo11 n=2 Tax=Acidiplasma TaxID=507753 RepID=A0A0Q0RWQ2_9ARCH|nr:MULTISPECIES: DNA-directed RNA polymerase subunit L [Acidiplasma]KJE48820.1 DNA-directed RNA polymerase subunit L [Acidiplasma sp. MBA-1]KPV47252.1 DNA-directed RNA polymerase subunit L [Acidiplasma aeolicum]KQB34311.1 DNA-directed RNA polymerase subunit L [Acidiplasma cupricumulans]KQB34427.1 DNA-directed RNA polymerase subunit L [Acidiplasma aeolicum]WMT54211.1 MAG: DNA-directed RNA polymerase subunit L [Acidiplasma sp.]